MKKLLVALLITTVLLVLAGCSCKHKWSPATCTKPRTCQSCGETEGEVLEHKWDEATCETAKHCTKCGVKEGDPLGHTFQDATCTDPQICSACQETSGVALGHTWEEATCAEPKTCTVCDVTEGEALEHSVDSWVVTKEATCSGKGESEGVCTVCAVTLSDEVPMIAHTPGDWAVTVAATETTDGERTKYCTVCNATLETESFELTEAERRSLYINKCKKYSYKDISRYPDDYIGEYAKFYGKVLQVMSEKSGDEITYVLRIGTSGYGYYDNVLYAMYTASTDEARILEDDMVTVYGMLGGEYTYETVMGNEITIPLILIEYVDQ